jgi:2'-5' RNA ligase
MLTLWLMPDAATYHKLGQLIADLSSVHQSPTFEPHVTLLSGITDDPETALKKTEQLAKQTSVLKASLTEIEYLEYFYRCLFFRTDNSRSIFELREQAEELFEHTQVNPFIPHISFLYGSMPVFQKEAIIEALGDKFLVDFKMEKLRLVRTELGPEHWELMGEFELNHDT